MTSAQNCSESSLGRTLTGLNHSESSNHRVVEVLANFVAISRRALVFCLPFHLFERKVNLDVVPGVSMTRD